ncbi:MAG: CopD family protein [Cytophagales bacterium]|nr:CopD family protein [Cytophagales bacterium]MDW8383631.1 CopD family protein [Flammeovirgaceae bacterium]
MEFLYLKAIHIIFIVTWFSGMFYLVRLLIYQREAYDKPEPEKNILLSQFDVMSKRLLFGITMPSAIITLLIGIRLVWIYPSFPSWLAIKIIFVLLLYLYHFSLHKLYNLHRKRVFKFSSLQLRMWNEVPTVLLVAIVLLVIVKQNMSLVYGFLGLGALMIALVVGIRIYKLFREKQHTL